MIPECTLHTALKPRIVLYDLTVQNVWQLTVLTLTLITVEKLSSLK